MLKASETAPRTKNKPKYVNIFIDVILKAMVSLYFQKFNIIHHASMICILTFLLH